MYTVTLPFQLPQFTQWEMLSAAAITFSRRSVSLLRPQQQHHVIVLPFRTIQEKVSLIPESVLQQSGISSSMYPQPREKETTHPPDERFGLLSAVPPKPNEKETSYSHGERGSTALKASAHANSHIQDGKYELGDNMSSRYTITKNVTSRKHTTCEDPDDWVKLEVEKELLKMEHHELVELYKDVFQTFWITTRILSTCEDTQRLLKRIRQVVKKSKDLPIKSFLEPLRHVSSDLGMNSSFAERWFSKMDASEDKDKAVPLLKNLLQCVEMACQNMAKVSLLPDPALQKFGISSSAFPLPNEQETCKSPGERGSAAHRASYQADSIMLNEKDESDFDLVDTLRDYLVKFVVVNEELQKIEHDKLLKMKDKIYRASKLINEVALQKYEEAENVRKRTSQEAENSKKFSIQVEHCPHA